MKFSSKTLLTAAVALGTAIAAINPANACGRSCSRGSSYGHGYRYVQPTYTHYRQVQQYRPVLQPLHPVQTVQPVGPQGLPQQQFAPQQQLAPQQQVAPQQQFAPQQQVAPQQQLAPQQQGLRTVGPGPQSSPLTANPSAVAPAAQPSAPGATSGSAQMSALQALGGFAPPAAAAPQRQIQTPAHVGTWSANLGNGASVRLQLNGNSSFTWTATNKSGSTSSFSGSYTVSNGSLNLIRSTDNQRLGGSMTTTGANAFSFKVAGNNAAAISFARS